MQSRALKRRRSIAALILTVFVLLFGVVLRDDTAISPGATQEQPDVLAQTDQPLQSAIEALETLEI